MLNEPQDQNTRRKPHPAHTPEILWMHTFGIFGFVFVVVVLGLETYGLKTKQAQEVWLDGPTRKHTKC